MKNEILFKVLQLDSIFGLLDWTERAFIHQYIIGKSKTLTEKILDAYGFIEDHDWDAPEMRYMDDRLLYFKHNGEWLLIAEYKKLTT
ncbi:hypothetical protein [Epilithonimonas arachidiradicis]|uniref:Uncharacterized protein n=1 Tax=Epilithonimonas arachidiradicis TaxID=1617282 RepID=A0A420DE24_9FLAO|nr:hypothetical protein [Epilithonimonas arachidiradicis]RKE90042.1 hypothetical protein BXY58_0627 [Epilithonimonas arachidiradicis]GGG47271.1 hypothetical protein GCM10007332_05990 [Epilithonimonas arachidiradicis]